MTKIIRRTVPEEYQNLLDKIYYSRGISSQDQLQKNLQSLLPFSDLLNIDKAVSLLEIALKEQHKIMIIGDFDADGATSSALAVSVLRSFGAKNVTYLVPNRFEYGYGLTPEIVQVAAQHHANLILTVDNGVSSFEGVKTAKSLGMTVVITDHHLAPEELPIADAIVNPNQNSDLFLGKNLAGVGVIFYVMMALRSRLRENKWFEDQLIKEPNLGDCLDLVALGTVADVVVLDQLNRIFVHQGLQRMRLKKTRLGIKALFEITGKNIEKATESDLGFVLAPRLNAAGRLEDMSLGIELLLTDDENQAREYAIQLDALNRERQAIEETMQKSAQSILEKLHFNNNLPLGICVFDETWHQGVIGILASRLKDQFYRPVIAMAKSSGTELKGSARSIPGLHLRDVLANINMRYPQLIKKFGGHAMAAGLTIEQSQLAEFSRIFNEEIKKNLSQDQLEGKIFSDGPLNEMEFTLPTAQMLREAGPWGQGFPEPLFDNVFYLRDQRLVGQKHLKMSLSLQKDSSKIIDAIAFNVDINSWPNHYCDKIHAAYRLDINEYRNYRNLQLIIHYFEVN